MQRSLTVITVLSLLAGCSTGPTDTLPRSRPPTAVVSSATVAPSQTNRVPAATHERTTVPALARSSATLVVPHDGDRDPSLCARSMVEAILNADTPSAVALATPSFDSAATWITEPIDAQIIDIVVLAAAGNRSRIGIGVAFTPAVDGTITEPIAYIVDVLDTPTGCEVIGIAYA